jgi:hypothetical protein
MVEPAVSGSNSPRTFFTKCPAIPAARKCSDVPAGAGPYAQIVDWFRQKCAKANIWFRCNMRLWAQVL